MAFYSSGQVKTLYLDPKSFVDGSRAVFELEGHHLAYLPNMRLLNIGVFGTATPYNDLIGANAIIERVTLYDGKTKLTERNKYGLYRGFVLHNQRNSPAMSIASQKNLNRLGFQRLNTDGALQFTLPNINSTTARDTTNNAMVELRQVLPMLNAVSHLPTDLFPNLRLEVVFNTSASSGVYNNDTNAINGQSIPLLAVDVLDDKNVVSKMNKGLSKGIQWLEVEHDQVLYPATANGGGAGDQGVEESKNFKLDGFKNKKVERLLLIKEMADNTKYIDTNAVQGFGKYSSIAFFNQKHQYRLNGKNVLPDEGIIGDAERLAYMVDTYGDSFAFPGSNYNEVDITGLVETAEGEDGDRYRGQLDYTGVYLGEEVKDLQVTINRTGLQDGRDFKAETSAINLHYFGEVQRGLVLNKKGGYMLAYL